MANLGLIGKTFSKIIHLINTGGRSKDGLYSIIRTVLGLSELDQNRNENFSFSYKSIVSVIMFC